MTRFARAKGSKASNERVPEDATSWNDMKKDLKKSQNDAKTKEEREKMNKLRQKTYDEFIDEEDKKVGKKWAEFPSTKKTPMKAKAKLKPNKKIKKIPEPENEDLEESDEEIDAKVEDFKKEIEQVLSKDKPEEKSSKQPSKMNKRKTPQKKDNTEFKRRKPDLEENMTVKINGEKQKIKRYDGFPVLETDFDRLKDLHKSLIKKGIPQSEVKRTMQNERRKAEKHLSRLKKFVCFNCRKSGHILSECPDLSNGKNSSLIEHSGTGICFKCGSTEHKLDECKSNGGLKYASCFICRQQGHISRECPDNPRGLYPQGGACRTCGDVTHLKKDCPQNAQQKAEKDISLSTIANGNNIESLDGEDIAAVNVKKGRKASAKKVVKF